MLFLHHESKFKSLFQAYLTILKQIFFLNYEVIFGNWCGFSKTKNLKNVFKLLISVILVIFEFSIKK